MVTCQSPNQLKTPAKVSWAFKMVSQFGSLGYTIMGKTADLTVVQKTIIDTLHKEGKPQTFIAKEAGCSQSAVSKHVNRSWVEGKSVEEKDAQPTERTAALWGLSSKIDSRIWGELHKEWTKAGVKASRATTHRRVKEFGYSIPLVKPLLNHRQRLRRLTWAKEKKNWTVAQQVFLFHLETKVLEPGGRVEKLIAQVAWSPVLSFHSLWLFGVQCHLLVLVHCVYWKPTSLHPLPRNFGALHASFCWPAF